MAFSRMELIHYVATGSGVEGYEQVSKDFSWSEAHRIVSVFVSVFQETMENKEVFRLNGLGIFTPTLVKARKGVHPRTREEIMIPEHWTVKFKPNMKFKRSIKNAT